MPKKKFQTLDSRYLVKAKRIEQILWELDPSRAAERLDQVWAQNYSPQALCHAMFDVYGLAQRQLEDEAKWKSDVISPLEFLGPIGLDKREMMWPAVVEAYEELCSGEYVEAVLTGGIGTAKTFLAVYALVYETYKICNLKNPHLEFGLDPASDIVMVFQSVTAGVARSVDYDLFRSVIDTSPWFQQNMEYEADLKSVLKFSNGLTVKPIASLETSAIGQNVISGLIDEINFFSNVADSRRALPGETKYDQAQANYNAIVRRRESRFMEKGELPGLLCLVSSTRYPGQFTDRKIEQAEREVIQHGKTRIFTYQKRVWEVRPKEAFVGDFFKVYIGERHRNPYIIPDEEVFQWDEDDPMIDLIPVEYRHSFEDDIHAALRDIAGKSTQSQHVYFSNMEKLDYAFGHHRSIFSVEKSDFDRPPLAFRPSLFQDPSKLHYAHVDLGATADSAGICIGHVREFVKIKRTNGVIEELPLIVIDGMVEVPPPKGGEIDFEKIRAIFYRARELGMNIKWVSYDSWQSRDSLQILKNLNFVVGTLSVDKDTKPYDFLKRAINDQRLLCPRHAKAEAELRGLQWLREKDKIDHLPNGSKDCADALAGVVYGLTMRRELWVRAGIRPTAIPVGDTPEADDEVI